MPDELLWFHNRPTQLSLRLQATVWKRENIHAQQIFVDLRGQRRKGRLLEAERKDTVSHVTTYWTQDVQKSIFGCQTWQMGSSSRRPHWELEFCYDIQIRVWPKQHETIQLCINGSGSCWCNRVGGNFLAHCTVFYPPTDASLQQDVSQISHYLKLLSWKWKSVLCTQTAFRVIRFPSSRAPLGRGGAGDGVRHVWRSQVSVDQNVWGRFRS